MSSGYNRFTNEGCDVEGAPGDVPLNYEKTSDASYPTQPPPPQYALQQPYVYQPQFQQPPAQQTIAHVPTGPIPNDYFGFALFVTICCCLPFGIVGLIKSSEVKNRAAVGDYNGAAISSSEARRWSWAGCIFGGVTWCIALVVTCVYIGLIVAACNAGNCDDY